MMQSTVLEEPLKISSMNIEFGNTDDKIRNLMLKNIHQSEAIAYKIKTNNLQALQATPNFGFIRANTYISLRIKAVTTTFEAKLLISYAMVGERPGDFNQVWNALNKTNIKNRQVKVWRNIELENILKYNQKIEPPKSYQPERNNKPIQSQPSQNNFVDQADSESQIQQLEQRLQQQKLKNAKVKQQLIITEEKLKEINQQRLQIKVNKSISIVCEDYHTSFLTLILFGLAVFVGGYVLAKWN